MQPHEDRQDLEAEILTFLAQCEQEKEESISPKRSPQRVPDSLYDLALLELERRHQRLEEALTETTEWQARTLGVTASHIKQMLSVLESAGLAMDPAQVHPKILKVVEGNLDELMAVMNDELDEKPTKEDADNA